MASNRMLLQKADAVLADLSSGGLLAPEQSARFVRKVMDQPTILRDARQVEMRAPTQEINKIGLGSRILRPAVENTALSSNDRSKPTFEKVTLQTTEVIAEVRLPYAMMEDAIERAMLGQRTDAGGTALSGGVRDTVVDLIAQRVAIDLEELALLGDTNSGDTYLALKDGWIKQIDTLSGGNKYDAAGGLITKDFFAEMIKTIPNRYKRFLPAMRHYMSANQIINYRAQLAERATQLGDSVIQGTAPVFGMGVPLSLPGVAWMPDANVVFTDPLNLIFGMTRDVMMEFDKIITQRQYVIVVTARVDFKIEEVEGCVLGKNVGVP